MNVDFKSFLIKKMFGGQDPENPMPFYFKYLTGEHAKKCQDARINARLAYLPFLSLPIPVYLFFGEKYISARTLAGILGSCPKWDTREEWNNFRFGQIAKLKKIVEESEYNLDDPALKKIFDYVTGTFMVSSTPLNRIATYSNLRNLTHHINTYVTKGGSGCLKVDSTLKQELLKLSHDMLDMDGMPNLDKHYLLQEHRIGNFFLNRVACRNLIAKYVDYNLRALPGINDLAMQKVNLLLGKRRQYRHLSTLELSVVYDTTKVRDIILESCPDLPQSPKLINAHLRIYVAGLLQAIPGVKKVLTAAFVDSEEDSLETSLGPNNSSQGDKSLGVPSEEDLDADELDAKLAADVATRDASEPSVVEEEDNV